MAKALINKFLNKLDLQIISSSKYKHLINHQLPDRNVPLHPKAHEEFANVSRMKQTFIELYPDSVYALESKSVVTYLNPPRITAYFEIIDLCERQCVKLAGQKIADVGCYFPYLFHLIDKYSGQAEMHAYDSAEAPLTLAKVFCPAAYIHVDDLLNIKEKSEYDTVFLMEVLEHMIEPDSGLKMAMEMLKPGGKAVVTVPDGRTDKLEAKNIISGGNSYQGHVNIWTRESWRHFISRHAPQEQFRAEVEVLNSGGNYAIIERIQ